MGWQKTTNKTEQPNNQSRTLTRDGPRSWAVTGAEVERILLERQYTSVEVTRTEQNGTQTQETTVACRVVGQILRVVGDKLDSAALKDEFEITHYGRF